MALNLEIFGDESTGSTAAVYGVFCVEQSFVQHAEDILRQHKKEFKIPENTKLHCKELFHYHARSKTPFREFSKKNIFEFYENLLLKLKCDKVQFSIGRARRINGKASLNLNFPGKNFTISQIKDEHLYIFSFISALTHLFTDPNIKTNIHIDRQKTKIDWFGTNKQVQTILREFCGIKNDPNLTSTSEKPLLEIADCIAYTAAKVSAPNDRDKDRFLKLIDIIKPLRCDFDWDQQVVKWN